MMESFAKLIVINQGKDVQLFHVATYNEHGEVDNGLTDDMAYPQVVAYLIQHGYRLSQALVVDDTTTNEYWIK